jgi:hypothetical protein
MSSRPLLVSLAGSLAGALVSVVSAGFLVACGAGGGGAGAGVPAAPGVASAKEGSDGGAATSAQSGAGAAPAPKPFAGSAAEATQLIGVAVDKNAAAVQKCIVEYRVRKNLPHERVTISMGIDQEGRLLGATLPKGKTDGPLSDCIQGALTNAAFPRSHSGVISITKSYEELVQ